MNSSFKNVLASLVCLLCSVAVAGAEFSSRQVIEKDSTKVKAGKLVILPLVYFKPETSWSFGAGSVYTFRLPGQSDEGNPQQIQIGASYSLKNQLGIIGKYSFYFKEDQYRLYGRLGYYKFSYQYYGNGNNEDKEEEIFFANYPGFDINAVSRVLPGWYAGFRFISEDYKVVETAETSRLRDGSIIGNNGGYHSGLGIVINYDNRDRAYCPSRGNYLETLLFSSHKVFGSRFNYTRMIANYSTFLSWKQDHVLAINIYGEFTNGQVPFNQLPLLGGSSRMRGYTEGFYRDKHYLTTQVEYRFPLFWRLGAAAFFSYGAVTNNFPDFKSEYWRYSFGGGLRFALDEKEKVNLRIDYGIGKNTSGFYLTVGESF